MRKTMGTIGATLAIIGVVATSITQGTWTTSGTHSGGEVISEAQPAGGPYFGKLDPAAHYYVKIDDTGGGVEDA